VQGWGRLRWELEEVRRLDPEGVARWIAAGAPGAAYDALEPVSEAQRRDLEARASKLAHLVGSADEGGSRAVLALGIELEFDGPFLVNDASQTGPGEDRPDHAPLRDAQGRAYLPAASFRGVLRSQAERILRTVRGARGACGPGAERAPCRPPGNVDDVPDLCPACRLFGAAGWRSPLRISDFTAADTGAQERDFCQEFLAIDRFTGGGAEEWQGLEDGAQGLKFNACSVLRPKLQGRVELDLTALGHAGDDERSLAWSLGLLALVLRDLVEGDLAFGWGSGKGYGRCEARIVAYDLPPWEALPERLRRDLGQVGLEGPEMLTDPAAGLLDEESHLGFALAAAVLDLAEVPIDEDRPAPSAGGEGDDAGGER
ncbi:MAG: RAMP superfamily CRISPR-associated protein, partial [Acidobacteriota bacterium]